MENNDKTPQPESLPEIPRLKYLQPAQYASWLRKVDDPDWYEHRYRDAKDRAMVSAIRELREALAMLAQKDVEIARALALIPLLDSRTIELATVEREKAIKGCAAIVDDMWDQSWKKTRNAILSLLPSSPAKDGKENL